MNETMKTGLIGTLAIAVALLTAYIFFIPRTVEVQQSSTPTSADSPKQNVDVRVLDPPEQTVVLEENKIPITESYSLGTTCEDVTSFDYNWENDMYCTNPDGSTFYTDYAGAEWAESN